MVVYIDRKQRSTKRMGGVQDCFERIVHSGGSCTSFTGKITESARNKFCSKIIVRVPQCYLDHTRQNFDKFVDGLKCEVRVEVLKSTSTTLEQSRHIAIRVDSTTLTAKNASPSSASKTMLTTHRGEAVTM